MNVVSGRSDADLLLGRKRGRVLYHLAIVSVAAALCLVGIQAAQGVTGEGSLWVVDRTVIFLQAAVLFTTFLTLLLTLGYARMDERHLGPLRRFCFGRPPA